MAPYHALLRDDLRGDPLVFLPGSLYVTQALDRRTSGTYYTPRQLAEEVVHHALDPVVYSPGPAQERDAEQWKLKPASELLDLKVADIAMGSGAFLVAACRYLAERLQEAWTGLGAGEWTAFGNRRDEAPDEPPVPADPLEREQLARRLVAERCLYGVDKNPMAVEMAKLSLWLITLARNQPFSFVDHALRAGDSLLGITDVAQLRVAHLDPKWPRQASLDLGFDEIESAVERALTLRRDLEAFVVLDVGDAERKARAAGRGRRRAGGRAAARRPHRRCRARAARRRRPAVRVRGRGHGADDARRPTPPMSRAARRARSCATSRMTGSSSTAEQSARCRRSSGPTATRSTGRWSSPRCGSGAGSTRSSATRRSRVARRSAARSAVSTATTW